MEGGSEVGRRWLALVTLMVSVPLLAVQSAMAAAAPAEVAEHHIGVRVVHGEGELYDRRTGETFVVRGANYVFREGPGGSRLPELFRVGAYDGDQVREDFARLAAHGYNTVRVFLDLCWPQDEGCIGVVDGVGLHDDYLANVADLTRAALDAGIHVLLTSNDLPDHGGYSQQANAVAGPLFEGYRNAFYLTPEAIEATRRYWRDLITGLRAQGASLEAILAWQLLNEQWMFADQPPLSLREGEVTTTTGTYDMADAEQRRAMVADGIVHYIAEMKAEIREHDPTALVTMGFFAPGAAPGWYTDPVDVLARSELDFLDFHAYPGSAQMAQVAQLFDIAAHPARPVILGEYGAFRHVYADLESAAAALAQWQAASCRAGFDGWLYWTYLSADNSVSDRTWGLTDANGYLLALLAPDDHPDPCARIEVPRANKALGARVRASASTRAEPPRNAVDDNVDRAWISGGDAEQWIRLDLRRPTDVREIQLIVSQYPAGRTTHVIEVRSRGERAFHRIGRLRGKTSDLDRLVVRPRRVARDVVSVRVRTLASPSWVAWREIRVYEEVQTPPA